MSIIDIFKTSINVPDALDYLNLIVIFIILVFHCIIYFSRRREKAEHYIFYFILLLATIIIYKLYTNTSIYFVRNFIFNIPYVVDLMHHRVDSFLNTFFSITIIFLIYKMNIALLSDFLHLKYKNLINGIYAVNLLPSVFIFVKGYFYFQYIVMWSTYFTILSFLLLDGFIVFRIIRIKYYKKPYVLISTIVTILISLYAIPNMYLFRKTNETVFFNNYFYVIIVVLIYYFIFSLKYNDEYCELQRLKNNLNDEVQKQTRELKDASEQKTDFFINLAHETKTPLTLIKNYLEFYIKKHGLNGELSIIRQNIDKMIKDIINFFDHEKLEKGIAVYNHDEINNFSKILEQKLILFKEYASGMRINILNRIEGQVFIKADHSAIDRIVNNLIENSIKYTAIAEKNETKQISVLLKNEEGNLLFTVKDNGVGIPVDYQSHIFENYYQVSHKTRNSQGIGMGLPIVKKLVSDLGGSITVESEPDNGATFTVRLNSYSPASNDFVNEEPVLDQPYDTFIKVNKPIMESDRDNKPVILVTEDNTELRSFIRQVLEKNFHVVEAGNGKVALERIKEYKPELILTDIVMPGMDGHELLRVVRDNEDTRDIPVILITAHEPNKTALTDKPNDILYKPFTAAELMLRVENILALTRSNREIDRLWEHHFLLDDVNIDPSSGAKEIKVQDNDYDPAKKSIMLVEDNNQLLLYLKNSLVPYYNVVVARDGSHALDKLTRIEKQPVVIVSDIMMPVMDGLTLYENLLKKNGYYHIPFVFLTAMAETATKLKALSLGAIDYICKPFLVDELLFKIESCVKLRDAQKNFDTQEFREKLSKFITEVVPGEPSNRVSGDEITKYHITKAEKKIIDLLHSGYHEKEIAYELNLSKYTVNTHLKNIYKKCGVNNKFDLLHKLFPASPFSTCTPADMPTN